MTDADKIKAYSSALTKTRRRLTSATDERKQLRVLVKSLQAQVLKWRGLAVQRGEQLSRTLESRDLWKAMAMRCGGKARIKKEKMEGEKKS